MRKIYLAVALSLSFLAHAENADKKKKKDKKEKVSEAAKAPEKPQELAMPYAPLVECQNWLTAAPRGETTPDLNTSIIIPYANGELGYFDVSKTMIKKVPISSDLPAPFSADATTLKTKGIYPSGQVVAMDLDPTWRAKGSRFYFVASSVNDGLSIHTVNSTLHHDPTNKKTRLYGNVGNLMRPIADKPGHYEHFIRGNSSDYDLQYTYAFADSDVPALTAAIDEDFGGRLEALAKDVAAGKRLDSVLKLTAQACKGLGGERLKGLVDKILAESGKAATLVDETTPTPKASQHK